MNNSNDVSYCILKQMSWNELPNNIKSKLGNDINEYNKSVLNFSLQNQLRFKNNLISKIFKSEKRYYDKLIQMSKDHMFLYPYHLQDIIVGGLRLTAFQYYIDMMCNVMLQERSYDYVPNFTAADCLRLLGIGRNQYIDLMNTYRGSYNNTNSLNGNNSVNSEGKSSRLGVMKAGKRLFGFGSNVETLRKDSNEKIRALLPRMPLESVVIEPWWLVSIGVVLEPDMEGCSVAVRRLIDHIIDCGPLSAGSIDRQQLRWLYQRGMVYLDVPIESECVVSVPTLEGFVMNRTSGDVFEVLMYKIFVAIDENTTVDGLAGILQIPLPSVQNAVSVFCRLQFAQKKMSAATAASFIGNTSWPISQLPHSSGQKKTNNGNYEDMLQTFLLEDGCCLETVSSLDTTSGLHTSKSMFLSPSVSDDNSLLDSSSNNATVTASSSLASKKVAFIFDSSLTAYLMMGNLSVGLKNHAVTMFEVGKLSEEGLDAFLTELDSISEVGEGEAQRYYEHAVNLRYTIRRLRQLGEANSGGVDLVRCGSLFSLDLASRSRMLVRNYRMLVSMAPINYGDAAELASQTAVLPQLGPLSAAMTTPWLRLFMLSKLPPGNSWAPASYVLSAGSRLRRLPLGLRGHRRLLATPWLQQHEPLLMSSGCALVTVNDALMHGPLLLQAYDCAEDVLQQQQQHHHQQQDGGGALSAEKQIAFPLVDTESLDPDLATMLAAVDAVFGLANKCGYLSYLETGSGRHRLLQLHFGIPLFDEDLNRQVLERLSPLHEHLFPTPNSETPAQSSTDYYESAVRLSTELDHFIAQYSRDTEGQNTAHISLPSHCLELSQRDGLVPFEPAP